MEALELEPGTIVGGRYRVERLVGRGGMGAVVEATDVARGGTYAVKVLRSRFIDSATVVERFRREARILDAIDHPAIVRIRDCGEAEQGVFIAMELLHGETFLERLRREGAMSPAALAPIVEGLCDALGAVHAKGVIHRDLKPANVFLPEGGETPVKLIDFGVAKVLDLARLTLTGQVVGTVSYMAPEQLSGRPVDERADVYAVGVMLHAALAGRPPFPRETHLAAQAILAGDVSALEGIAEPIAAVVSKAMAVEPRHRFSSARKLGEALRAALGEAGDAAHRALEPRTPADVDPSTAPTALGSARSVSTRVDRPVDPGPTDPFSLVRLRAQPRARWVAVTGGAVVLLFGLGIAGLAMSLTDDDPDEPAARLVPQPAEPSTPPVTAPVPSTIEIASTPTGAGVFEEDVMLGNTPFALAMQEGDAPRPIQIRHPGYEPSTIVVRPGDPRFDVTLSQQAPAASRPSTAGDRRGPSRSAVPMRATGSANEVMDPWR